MNQTKEDEKKLIRHMLDEIQADIDDKGSQSDFIDSINEQFENRGTLTAKQIEAVRKYYERI